MNLKNIMLNGKSLTQRAYSVQIHLSKILEQGKKVFSGGKNKICGWRWWGQELAEIEKGRA